MRSYTSKPKWVRDLAKSSPCIVYSENETRIVSGQQVEGKFVAVTYVLPASVTCDPATLPGQAPHSRSSRVLRGAGGEGFCPGEVEAVELPVPYPLPRHAAARGKRLTLAETVLVAVQGRSACVAPPTPTKAPGKAHALPPAPPAAPDTPETVARRQARKARRQARKARA